MQKTTYLIDSSCTTVSLESFCELFIGTFNSERSSLNGKSTNVVGLSSRCRVERALVQNDDILLPVLEHI